MQNQIYFYYNKFQSMHEEIEEMETNQIFKYNKQMIARIKDVHAQIHFQK
jgi:hypothetical protein